MIDAHNVDLKNSYYLDLFDDELYDIASVNTNPEIDSDLVNTIRLQTLLCILFDRTIVVPEQWAISSASFLKVAEEVISTYPAIYKKTLNSREQTRVSVKPPFYFVFFQWEKPVTTDVYMDAMIRRVYNGNAIKISPRTRFPQYRSGRTSSRYITRKIVRDDSSGWSFGKKRRSEGFRRHCQRTGGN